MTAFHFYLLIVIGLLTLSTGVTIVLCSLKPENRTLQNVRTIVRSWWLIVAVIAGALALGKYALLALFFVLSLVVLREYLKKSHYGRECRKSLFIIMGGVLTLQYVALLNHSDHLFFVLIPLLILLVAPLIIILTNAVANMPTAFGVITGLMLLNYYLSHIPALAFTEKINWNSSEQPMVAVLILVFFTECNDIFQFLSGKLMGRKKIVPHVSPNKTEMGFIGGMACTTLAMALVAPYVLQLSRSQGAFLGLAVSVFGIFGDLFFSAVKRYLGIKDFSQALPGHGGFIDRIDSLVFTAPIYFHLLTYLK